MKKPIERPFVESFAEQAGLLKRKKTSSPRLYYLSGAVSKDPHAKLKFNLAELYLKSQGHMVINPLKLNPIGTKWEDAISSDLAIINQMKDIYYALIHLSKFMDEDKIIWPAMIDIDPPDRQFDSSGKRLEKAVAFNVLPTVQMPKAWDELLNRAIMESEANDDPK